MPVQYYIKHAFENEGASISKIAKNVDVCWRTAAKYAYKEDWNESPPTVKKRRRPVMDPVADIVDTWLLEDQLLPRKDRRNAAAIYRELRDEHSFEGSERTVREYVRNRRKELLKEEPEPTAYVELVHEPGEAQADFGTIHCVRDSKIVEARALILSFPWSNAGFAVPMPSENAECLLEGLRLLFDQAGGVPQRLVLDNATTMVATIGKGEERTLTEAFMRFQLHYRFDVDFCAPARGNEKGNVENKVGYSRRQWLCPLQPLNSFEELGEELAIKAIRDMDRPHYKKGRSIADMWQEEQSALLPLPSVPFEAVRLDAAVLNNYAQFRFESETYSAPQGKPRQKVLLSVYWDRIEVRNREGEVLTTLPRHYMLKEQPIDWLAHFEIYSRRARATVHSAMFRYLPEAVQAYLKEANASERSARVRFVRDMLKTYSIDEVAKALEALPADRRANPANVELKLYALNPENGLPKPIVEGYTPIEVAAYNPDSAVYDRLLPARAKGAVRA